MNPNLEKAIGLFGKAVWEFTEGKIQEAVTDFFVALGLLGLHNKIVGAMKAKGMEIPGK